MSLIEKFVTQWLHEVCVEFLTALCTEYNIVVPDAKAGKHQDLLKLVLRHLTSAEVEESDDQGTAIYLKLFNELGVELGKGQPKPEPLDNGAVNNSPNVTVTKLREFKINGSIDGGKAGTLSYTSLSCQLKQAEAAGYSIAEVIAAVIRAIPAGSSFRSLLEAKGNNLEKEDFFKLLRSHYKERDSSRVLQELLNCYQLPGQDAHEFCCMAMALRDRVQSLSEEEGNPGDVLGLTGRLYHTIFTGLKQNSIRMELLTDIKAANLTDVEFLEKVSLAEANETERLEKVKTKADIALLTESGGGKNASKSSSASQKAKSADTAPADPKITSVDSKIDLLLAKIDQISTNSSALNDRISRLENNMADVEVRAREAESRARDGNFQRHVGDGARHLHGNGPTHPSGGRKIFKCAACVAGNVGYCNHCFKCSSTDHKKQDCPEN